MIINRVSKGGIILGCLGGGEQKGGIRETQKCLNKSTDLRKHPCVRETLKADAKVGFHITEWEDFCLEAAQTTYKYEHEQTEASDEQSSASGETMLVSWEERVGV